MHYAIILYLTKIINFRWVYCFQSSAYPGNFYWVVYYLETCENQLFYWEVIAIWYSYSEIEDEGTCSAHGDVWPQQIISSFLYDYIRNKNLHL